MWVLKKWVIVATSKSPEALIYRGSNSREELLLTTQANDPGSCVIVNLPLCLMITGDSYRVDPLEFKHGLRDGGMSARVVV